jgi:glucosamine--fructose-6-phosphate aminotransferase (isomerizing)
MCGIFAYSGQNADATQIVFNGLKRLDYRGYDSWGLGVLAGSKIIVEKHIGAICQNKCNLPKTSVAIGHTRWATNGEVTLTNTHPIYASDKSFILVHNGIVENILQLRRNLIRKGFRFLSETDTEVIVRLIEEKHKKLKSLSKAVRGAFKRLEGRNTILVLDKNGQIIGARSGSPLVVGFSSNSSGFYFSSDTCSLSPCVDEVVVVNSGRMVETDGKEMTLSEVLSGKVLKPKKEKIVKEKAPNGVGNYDHYMIKEINEEPLAIRKIFERPRKEFDEIALNIRKARVVYCIGSGTAGAAAFQMAFFLRSLANIFAVGIIGSEAKDYLNLIGRGDLVIALSQSGETADVIEPLEKIKKRGIKLASFVNMPGSMLTQLSDYKYMAQAGPEICVMSTKVYASQIAWAYLVAKTVVRRYLEGKKVLEEIVLKIDNLLKDRSVVRQIKKIAYNLSLERDIFLLAKEQNLQIVREGMIKIIEGSYIHAHAIPAGDLKHYAITLIEKGKKVITVLSNDTAKTDVINAVREVKARGADVVAVSPFNFDEFDELIRVPDGFDASSIINIVPLQLLAYYMAVSLNHNVDKPRNIAKSVTVK